MSQMEPERMLDPAQLPRQYPTQRAGADATPVHPDETYGDYLDRTGQPDTVDSSTRFAVGQRMGARNLEGRVALTAGDYGPASMIAPPSTSGPTAPQLVVGPQPNNRRVVNNERPAKPRRWFGRGRAQ